MSELLSLVFTCDASIRTFFFSAWKRPRRKHKYKHRHKDLFFPFSYACACVAFVFTWHIWLLSLRLCLRLCFKEHVSLPELTKWQVCFPWPEVTGFIDWGFHLWNVVDFSFLSRDRKCMKRISIDRFHSRDQQPCKFIVTKESFYIRKEFNSHRIGFTLQHGRRDVTWKPSITMDHSAAGMCAKSVDYVNKYLLGTTWT